MSTMKEALPTLWDYNFWARQVFAESIQDLTVEEFLRDLGDGCGSVRDKLAHIVAADKIWLERIQGNPSPPFARAEEFPDQGRMLEIWETVHAEYRTLLEKMQAEPSRLNEPIAYRNLAGKAFSTPLGEILLHVANHATYHRGQAASLYRRLKGKPPVTDLIQYFRSRAT